MNDKAVMNKTRLSVENNRRLKKLIDWLFTDDIDSAVTKTYFKNKIQTFQFS